MKFTQFFGVKNMNFVKKMIRDLKYEMRICQLCGLIPAEYHHSYMYFITIKEPMIDGWMDGWIFGDVD
jgi:hypothetical protein